jgi:nucleoside-diphosphate-sugar epimerase
LEYRALPAADVPAFVLDVRKARLELQWTPTTDMDFGIAVTKRWIEETYLR